MHLLLWNLTKGTITLLLIGKKFCSSEVREFETVADERFFKGYTIKDKMFYSAIKIFCFN